MHNLCIFIGTILLLSVRLHDNDDKTVHLRAELNRWWQIRVGQSLNISKSTPSLYFNLKNYFISLYIIQLSLCKQSTGITIITFEVTIEGERIEYVAQSLRVFAFKVFFVRFSLNKPKD